MNIKDQLADSDYRAMCIQIIAKRNPMTPTPNTRRASRQFWLILACLILSPVLILVGFWILLS